MVYRKMRELEVNAWDTFITDRPDLYVAQACLEKTSPRKFWSISEQFPDLVCCLHTHVRLMGSLGLNGGIPWLKNTEDTLCFICKQENETLSHFFCMHQFSPTFRLTSGQFGQYQKQPFRWCPHVALYHESQSTS